MKPNIIVAIPSQGTVKTKTCLCVCEMCLHHGEHIAANWTLDGTYLHRTREKLLKAATETPATHLFFIDSDIIFPPDGLERLLKQKKGVIGGTYNLKQQKEETVNGKKVSAIKVHKPLEAEYGTRQLKEYESPGVTHEVRAIPTGFMLLDLDVVRSVPQPWFDYGRNNEDEWMGEDVFFCEKFREHGHKIWCDPSIPIGHIGDWVY